MTITEMNNMPPSLQEEILKRIDYHYIPSHTDKQDTNPVLTYTQPKMTQITKEELMDLLETYKQVQQEIKDSMKQTSVEDSAEDTCEKCEQDPCVCEQDPIGALRMLEDELKEFADFIGLHAKITYTTKEN